MQEYIIDYYLRFFFFLVLLVKMFAYDVVLVDVFKLCYVFLCSFGIRI